MPELTQSLIDDTVLKRFWNMVHKDICWLWTGSTGSGYGRFNIRGELYTTHILSYFIHKGPIPDGYIVSHTCDNRHCVNPDHLYLTTMSDKMKDCIAQGIATPPDWTKSPILRGEQHGHAKLTTQDVINIKRWLNNNVYDVKQLAAMFNVSLTQIYRINNGDRWSHIVD